MELEVIGRKKTDSKKSRKGKTSEAIGFIYQLENDDEGTTATIKSPKDLFEVGDIVELEIDSHQSTLAADTHKKEKKEK